MAIVTDGTPRSSLLFSTGDVERLLGIPASTIKAWEKRGYLPGLHRVGKHRRFNEADLKRLLQVQILCDTYHTRPKILAALARGEQEGVKLPVVLGGGPSVLDQSTGPSYDQEELLNLVAQNAALFVEQRRVANNLATLERKYKRLLSNLPDVVISAKVNGQVDYISPGVIRYGANPESLVGKDLGGLFEFARGSIKELRQVLAGERPEAHSEVTVPNSQGEDVILDVFAIHLEQYGFLATCRDITAQKKLEQELAERREETLQAQGLVSAIMAASRSAIVATDLDHRVTMWNRAATEMLGWQEDEVIGKHNPAILDDEKAKLNSPFRLTLRGEQVVEHVERRCKDGGIIRLLLSTSPLYDRRGGVAGVVGVYHPA